MPPRKLEALVAMKKTATFTLLWRDWIEALARSYPDQRNGSLEWAIVAGLAVISIVVARPARSRIAMEGNRSL
jgi:hypothetical protein